MKRIRRWMIKGLAALSLAVCAAWARSYTAATEIDYVSRSRHVFAARADSLGQGRDDLARGGLRVVTGLEVQP
jgi:hypothetical protein